MNARLLLGVLLAITTACHRESEVQPNATSLASEVAGTYRSNFYLDLSCVAIPADKMPYAELRAESDSTITLVYTRLYPQRESHRVEHISLSRKAEVIQLSTTEGTIGTVQTDRVFTNNGMEKQGQLLRIFPAQTKPAAFLSFVGAKQ